MMFNDTHENFLIEGENQIELARQLVFRLERISVDSHWAWRASGLRRSLLHCLDEINEPTIAGDVVKRLGNLVVYGFTIIENAARDMRNFK
jgi:hypothetical protein